MPGEGRTVKDGNTGGDMEWIVFIAVVAFLFNVFGKSSPEKCPGCDGGGRSYSQEYDSQRDKVYDTSSTCSICSGAGKVRFVRKEKGIKYYEPVWTKE